MSIYASHLKVAFEFDTTASLNRFQGMINRRYVAKDVVTDNGGISVPQTKN